MPKKTDPQSIGSLVSYMRRYSLQSMLNLAVEDDDDDGNAATKQNKPQKEPIKKEQKNTWTEAQRKNIFGILSQEKWNDTKKRDFINFILEKTGKESISSEIAGKIIDNIDIYIEKFNDSLKE